MFAFENQAHRFGVRCWLGLTRKVPARIGDNAKGLYLLRVRICVQCGVFSEDFDQIETSMRPKEIFPRMRLKIGFVNGPKWGAYK